MSDVPMDDQLPPPGSPRPPHRLREAMSASDAVLWNIEHDPVLRSTIAAIALFDRAPDWERLSARLEQAVITVPRLGQRVVTTPLGLGPPRWVRRPRLRPRLPPATGAGPRTARPLGRARHRPAHRHGRLRPGAAALGVHPRGGPGRRWGRPHPEGAPLAHRRRGRRRAGARPARRPSRRAPRPAGRPQPPRRRRPARPGRAAGPGAGGSRRWCGAPGVVAPGRRGADGAPGAAAGAVDLAAARTDLGAGVTGAARPGPGPASGRAGGPGRGPPPGRQGGRRQHQRRLPRSRGRWPGPLPRPPRRQPRAAPDHHADQPAAATRTTSAATASRRPASRCRPTSTTRWRG